MTLVKKTLHLIIDLNDSLASENEAGMLLQSTQQAGGDQTRWKCRTSLFETKGETNNVTFFNRQTSLGLPKCYENV